MSKRMKSRSVLFTHSFSPLVEMLLSAAEVVQSGTSEKEQDINVKVITSMRWFLFTSISLRSVLPMRQTALRRGRRRR